MNAKLVAMLKAKTRLDALHPDDLIALRDSIDLTAGEFNAVEGEIIRRLEPAKAIFVDMSPLPDFKAS